MIIEELLKLEHEGWKSLCNGTGADFYGAIMTEDAVMVLANGVILDRMAVVASLNIAPPWDRYDITDERVIPTSEGGAILVYTGRGYRDGEGLAFTALMSSVYIRRGSSWKLALYQQTPRV